MDLCGWYAAFRVLRPQPHDFDSSIPFKNGTDKFFVSAVSLCLLPYFVCKTPTLVVKMEQAVSAAV